ncbi:MULTISPECIES: L-aspartate oxidase [unclassified Microbacterium]|uniref:L-aspartate oxidase n=1 Tax=unclassified Microbacterium TaxID=2609290 RepID=UPI0012FA10F2|nr:FAD-binding protein [Microbacterium sp. MAH-37]MVQ41925.1 FAD-dependent oxidoreductase [Microbacterium sp. MAH-37]
MNVVVVGSGIAGLTAALHAHEAGHAVTLVVKDALGGGSTPLAQGGIAGVYGPGDSAAEHAADTHTAGAGLSDPVAVDVLVADAAVRIAELAARGVVFDRTPDGALARGQEAVHSHPRIAHAGGDATGAAISAALVAQVRQATSRTADDLADGGRHAAQSAAARRTVRQVQRGIEIVEHAFLTDLVVEDGACRGIRILVGPQVADDLADGGRHAAQSAAARRTVRQVPRVLRADAVILATGAAGQLYAHTTNPAGATGDGIAAALRAGAAVADLEFVQFHPTMLAVGAPFLISEAVRGEGAVLRDAAGRRFAFDAHPDGELAPRDVVARAIARQQAADGAPVRLDATALGAARLAERFPTIDRVVRERGLDWAHEPIPVTPAEHYLMGGIATDVDGRTSVPGLFAVGEVARTGVHGANRLASNSLLEGAVFAARAVEALGRPWTSGTQIPSSPTVQSDEFCDAEEPFTRAALQRLMWDEVGLLRTTEGLAHALGTVRAWRERQHPPITVAEHEDANLLLVAEATAAAALARPVSVGAHFLEPALIGAR